MMKCCTVYVYAPFGFALSSYRIMVQWIIRCAILLLYAEWSYSVFPKFLNCFNSGEGTSTNQYKRSDEHLTALLANRQRKRNFYEKRDALRQNGRRNGCRSVNLSVTRQNVFDDSFDQLHSMDSNTWNKAMFEAKFIDILDPKRPLFTTSADRVSYAINPACSPDDQCVDYFRFIGRIIGTAVSSDVQLPCYFTPSIYKHLLGKSVDCTDLKSEDPERYASFEYIQKTDVSVLNEEFGYDLTFSQEASGPHGTVVVDLIPNGRHIHVTNENKNDYVQRMCRMHLIGVSFHNEAFCQGFYDVIQENLLAPFDEYELELLISGVPKIDIKDLKRHTEYYEYTSSSKEVKWFWKALGEFDQNELAMFLRFVTGSPKPPMKGFASLSLKFTIKRVDTRGSVDTLPRSHICWNDLRLPRYTSYETLRDMLRTEGLVEMILDYLCFLTDGDEHNHWALLHKSADWTTFSDDYIPYVHFFWTTSRNRRRRRTFHTEKTQKSRPQKSSEKVIQSALLCNRAQVSA